MKAYSEYKAMNLPWLKAIPAHWEIRRNKNVFTEMKEEVGEHSSEYTLLSLTLNGIIPRDMDAGGKFPSDFGKYKVVKKGYMAFCLFDVDETPRTVGLSNFDGMLTGAYTNANGDTVFSNTVSPFAFLLLQANGMGGQHDLILYGDQANTELL